MSVKSLYYKLDSIYLYPAILSHFQLAYKFVLLDNGYDVNEDSISI